MIGQIVDVVSAVGQHSGVAIDVTNAGIRRNDAFQTLGRYDAARHNCLSCDPNDFDAGNFVNCFVDKDPKAPR